jgi:hypothetical protein
MVNNWNNQWNWLVVTGTMEFYDFPFSWEQQSQLTNNELHDFSEGFVETTNQ